MSAHSAEQIMCCKQVEPAVYGVNVDTSWHTSIMRMEWSLTGASLTIPPYILPACNIGHCGLTTLSYVGAALFGKQSWDTHC